MILTFQHILISSIPSLIGLCITFWIWIFKIREKQSRGTVKETLKTWVCTQIRELKIEFKKEIENLREEWRRSEEKRSVEDDKREKRIEKRIDERFELLNSNFQVYRAEKHNLRNELNNAKMGNELLIAQLEKNNNFLEKFFKK